MRNVYCKHYSRCLDDCIGRGLKDFDCTGCERFESVPVTLRDVIAGNEKAKWIKEQSPMMRHRRRQWDRELSQFAQQFDPSRFEKFEAAKDAFFAMIGAVDAVATYPTWLAGYNVELERSGDHARAVEFADKTVRRTQPVAAPKDLSYFQRGGKSKSELHKMFTMFYTFFSVFQNRMQETGAKRRLGKINMGQAALSYWWIMVFPAFLGALIQRRRLPEGWEWFKDIVGYRLAGLPFIRDIISPALSGFDYTMTPVESALEVPSDVFKAVTSDKPKGRVVVKQLLKFAGYSVGLPAGQAVVTMDGMLDLMEGKTDNPTALIFREDRSKKRKRRLK